MIAGVLPLVRVVARRLPLALAVTLAVGGPLAACQGKKKEPPLTPALPEIAGMDAIPAEARVLVGVEVARLADSWLVRRAIDQMFLRDPALEARVRKLTSACQLNLATDIERFIIGLGAGADIDQGVMSVAGALSEAELVACVQQAVASDGGAVAVEAHEGRSLYRVTSTGSTGSQSLWFTFPAPRSVVVATSRAWMIKAIGAGTKAAQDPMIAKLLSRTNQQAELWLAGEMSAEVGAGLLSLTKGIIGQPPRAMFGAVGLRAGASVDVGVVMQRPEDANALISMINGQIRLGANVLQGRGLSQLLQKLEVSQEDDMVRLRASLSEDELKEILSRIDTPPASTENPSSPTPSEGAAEPAPTPRLDSSSVDKQER